MEFIAMRNQPNAAGLCPVPLLEEVDQTDPASGVPGIVHRPEGNDGAWIVTYECESDQRNGLDDSFIEIMADELIDHFPINSRPVVSAVGTAIHLTFQVLANASTAIPIGVEHTWTALEACGLSDYQITKAAQISLTEHQRQANSGRGRLHLLNASECARELEITRQRVAQLIDAGSFPEPAGLVGRRPVWSEVAILGFKIRRADH